MRRRHGAGQRRRIARQTRNKVNELRKADASIRYVANRRYVVDHGVVTTTGVSASLPVSLAMAAIGGRERADSLAHELGLTRWDAAHETREFGLKAGFIAAYVANSIEFWRHETIGIPVSDGVDEIALALTSNAYATTHLARVKTLAIGARPVVTNHGLRLLPDGSIGNDQVQFTLAPLPVDAPGRALDGALADITERYGVGTARVVRMELEYPEDVAAIARAP